MVELRQNVVKTTEEGLKRSSERQLRRKVKTLFWPPLFFATAALRCDLTPPPFAFFLSSTTLTLRPSSATTIATKGTTIVNMSFLANHGGKQLFLRAVLPTLTTSKQWLFFATACFGCFRQVRNMMNIQLSTLAGARKIFKFPIVFYSRKCHLWIQPIVIERAKEGQEKCEIRVNHKKRSMVSSSYLRLFLWLFLYRLNFTRV